jgi:hypothetical protein
MKYEVPIGEVETHIMQQFLIRIREKCIIVPWGNEIYTVTVAQKDRL